MGLGTTLALLAGISVSCGTGTGAVSEGEGSEPSGSILVFAAASLTDAFEELSVAFELAHPEFSVDLNVGGSATLRSQIEEGAPADVFASANEENVAAVGEAGRLDAEPTIFATNRLTIAVPAGNEAGIDGLADFARDDLLIGLCAEQVPCGEFARQALFAAGVDAAADTNEPDVRALLTKVAAGELDAGIVYVTDVSAAGERVEAVDFAGAEQLIARYPIAPVAGSNPSGAAAFIEFVLSAEGRAILTAYGFGTP